MPKYRVKSGAMNHVVETAFDAQPKMIAAMAFMAEPRANNLGKITSRNGGKFTGDNEMYVWTEHVLGDMGMMQPSNAKVNGSPHEGDAEGEKA